MQQALAVTGTEWPLCARDMPAERGLLQYIKIERREQLRDSWRPRRLTLPLADRAGNQCRHLARQIPDAGRLPVGNRGAAEHVQRLAQIERIDAEAEHQRLTRHAILVFEGERACNLPCK